MRASTISRGRNYFWNGIRCRILFHYLNLGTCGLPCTPVQKTSRNFSITYRHGFMSGFLTSPLLLSYPKPPPPEPPPLSHFLRRSFFSATRSTQEGVVVTNAPHSTRRCNSLNSNSKPVSMSSIDIVLHKSRNTCTPLWILS